MLDHRNLSRRTFLMGSAAVLVAAGGAAALSGCATSASSTSASASASSSSASASSASSIAVNDATEDLKLVLLGKDSKIAAIIVAMKSGYYDEEKLNIGEPEVVSGGFPEAMPMLSTGKVDVLPFGSIPTCTYVGKGDDLVIFGGTVTDGSECVTLIENKDKYKKAEDFKGKKIGCFRMETGHMVTKSWLRQQGLKIGPLEEGNDVEFVLLENAAAEVASVENGEIDMCFVNSGYGYVAVQGGKCAIAFRPNELIGSEFPCCRQSTNRNAYETKKSALVKFEIANLRALYDIENDHAGTIAKIVEYSGQPEEYIESITYGKGDYVAAMKFEMDPCTDAVKSFYGDMVDNGDIENADKNVIVDHLDSEIYRTALQTLIDRGEHADFYKDLMAKYKKQNTLGV